MTARSDSTTPPPPILKRWVGIDEAGYGPNLGPLVMTLVVAEGPDDSPPRVWDDLASTVSRADDPSRRLWVDDSKRVFRARKGRDRLDSATLALIDATARPAPRTLGGLFELLGAGSLEAVELAPWLDPGHDPRYPSITSRSLCDAAVARRPFEGAPWRIVDVRSVVVGPKRFNDGLLASPTNTKATVHFAAFVELLRHLQQTTPPDQAVAARGDKHGGRHFYAEPLRAAFPEAEVIAGAEGPDLSAYQLISPGRSPLSVELVPRADGDDGLVALASIVSKTAREHWMDAFNAHWLAQIPGLKPTAGYPVDALRFRRAIEPLCQARGLAPPDWWRVK